MSSNFQSFEATSQGCYLIEPQKQENADYSIFPSYFGESEDNEIRDYRQLAVIGLLSDLSQAETNAVEHFALRALEKVSVKLDEYRKAYTAQRVGPARISSIRLPLCFMSIGRGASETSYIVKGIANRNYSEAENQKDIVIFINTIELTTLRSVCRFIVQNLKVSRPQFYKEKPHLPEFDFSSFSEWNANTNDNSLVIILIESLENSNVALVSELLNLLSEWASTIPFVCLVGISTHMVLAKKFLSPLCRDYVEPTIIDIKKNEIIIDLFIEEALLRPDLMIKMSQRTYTTILRLNENSLKHTNSIIDGIKLAYMSFCYNNPLAILPLMFTDDYDISKLQSCHYEYIRSMPSFKKYVQSLIEKKPDYLKRLLNDNEFFRNEIIERCRQESKRYFTEINEVVRFIFQSQFLILHPLTKIKQMKEIFGDSLGPQFCSRPYINDIISGIKRLPIDTIIKVLNLSLHNFKSSAGKDSEQLQSLHDELAKADWKGNQDKVHSFSERFSSVLKDIIDSRNYSYKDMLLYELFVIENYQPVIDLTFANPRYCIQQTLLKPKETVQALIYSRENMDLQEISDAALIYQLICYVDRYFTVVDVFSAFISRVTTENNIQSKEEQSCTKITDDNSLGEFINANPQIVARFSEALKYLKVLGIINAQSSDPMYLRRQVFS